MVSDALYNTGDIIVAEATPAGRGGISVIRISGAGARELAGKLFDREMPPGGRHRYGRLVSHSTDGERVIDEVVMLSFEAPHSYTGEEMVEVSVHGSPVVVAEVLEAFYGLGARPARPGEFTLRAFLNSRMDLTQAEAVADLIAARSRQAADQARRQLQGGIAAAAGRVSDLVARTLSLCEIELDFVEEDVELAGAEEKLGLIEEAQGLIQQMLAGYQTSRRLREGVKVAITGAPNVGKSSLFNALLGQDRAIVHAMPGTTRDSLQAACFIGGISFELFDTAGIRECGDEIEQEGMRRAQHIADDADIQLFVSSVDTESFQSDTIASGKSALYVINKVDLGLPVQAQGALLVSALKGTGLDNLRVALYRIAASDLAPGEGTISRERHFNELSRAHESLQRAAQALQDRQPGELVAEDLRGALSAVDELTGRRRLDNLLDEIFAGFCIGK